MLDAIEKNGDKMAIGRKTKVAQKEEVAIAKEEKSKKEVSATHLLKDEEKSAVSIGVVLGIFYTLVALGYIFAPQVTVSFFEVLLQGTVEVKAATIDPIMFIIGLLEVIVIGVLAGFFYARAHNLIKKA